MPTNQDQPTSPSSRDDQLASEVLAGMRALGGSSSHAWNTAIAVSTLGTAYSADRLCRGDVRPNDVTDDMLEATKAALNALAPGDEIEAMLAAQAIGLHSACMEALRLAAHPDGEDVGETWERATALNRGMLDNLAALDRRRAMRQAAATPSDAGPSGATPAPSAAETGSADHRPPPPPPPPMPKPLAPNAPNEFTVLSDEELARYGYRSRPSTPSSNRAEIPGDDSPTPT